MQGTSHQRWTHQVEHLARRAHRDVESGDAIEMFGGLLMTFLLLGLVMALAVVGAIARAAAWSPAASSLVTAHPTRRRP
jgi:hypothetical protein